MRAGELKAPDGSGGLHRCRCLSSGWPWR
jgi:hypothetical protein